MTVGNRGHGIPTEFLLVHSCTSLHDRCEPLDGFRSREKVLFCTFPSKSKFLFILLTGTVKNIPFTSSIAIHGYAAACSVAVGVVVLGTTAVIGAVLAFECQ